MSEVNLTPIRAGHEFDLSALENYMSRQVEGFRRPISILQFEGGQSNPTFLIESPDKRFVLRKQPPGILLPSAHQVDREHRVMKALNTSDVPVPEMYALCEDTGVIGTKFYVMEMVDGRLYTTTALPDLTKDERKSVYLDMARILASLHAVDPSSVGLSDFGRPGNYFGRQVARWSRQYIASQTETIDAMDSLMEWLPDNLPDETPPRIVHGDYRMGNVLLDESEPRVVAVLDWELCTLGDGMADLGYWCQEYHSPASKKPGMIAGADLEALGIPTESELIQVYCDHAGLSGIENWLFYVIFNLFRSAGIIQGVYKRGLDGNASSQTALEYAGAARERSELAWSILQSNNMA
ncbi:MAG: phosphotransferase [Gammaproteobacteria bacterium]|nr:phosphotransferase [Gammaproteobacteria bacterium]